MPVYNLAVYVNGRAVQVDASREHSHMYVDRLPSRTLVSDHASNNLLSSEHIAAFDLRVHTPSGDYSLAQTFRVEQTLRLRWLNHCSLTETCSYALFTGRSQMGV